MKTTFGSASLCRSKTLCQSASLKWRSNTQYVNEIYGAVIEVGRKEKQEMGVRGVQTGQIGAKMVQVNKVRVSEKVG